MDIQYKEEKLTKDEYYYFVQLRKKLMASFSSSEYSINNKEAYLDKIFKEIKSKYAKSTLSEAIPGEDCTFYEITLPSKHTMVVCFSNKENLMQIYPKY